jgi:hypothetical protein
MDATLPERLVVPPRASSELPPLLSEMNLNEPLCPAEMKLLALQLPASGRIKLTDDLPCAERRMEQVETVR